jgi:hypothetical protein
MKDVKEVWLVGIEAIDGSTIKYVCLSKETAERRWNDVRHGIIIDLKARIEYMTEFVKNNNEGRNMYITELQQRINVLTLPTQNEIGNATTNPSWDIPFMYCMGVEP